MFDDLEQAPVGVEELELIFLNEPNGMSALCGKPPTAVIAAADQNGLAGRFAVGEPQIGQRLRDTVANERGKVGV